MPIKAIIQTSEINIPIMSWIRLVRTLSENYLHWADYLSISRPLNFLNVIVSFNNPDKSLGLHNFLSGMHLEIFCSLL